MFNYLRVKQRQPPDPLAITIQQLERDSRLPITLRYLNNLPTEAKRRLYRSLIPPDLLIQFDINPINWKGIGGEEQVKLYAEPGSGKVNISASSDTDDPFFVLELSDNTHNSIDLDLLLLNDPSQARFATDLDEQGRPTYFGTVYRHMGEEIRAMQAGLAPGQVRAGLGLSGRVFQQLEAFLVALGHTAIFLEPLTYASAWVFERRGFAYVRGHQLMDSIHREFQAGGRLLAALDGNTPFRQPAQAQTIRGRAWAVHDGILAVIDANWEGLRMVKQIGRRAGVNTAPETEF